MKILKNTIQMKNGLIVFDYMIADMLSNKKLVLVVGSSPVAVTELFIRRRKLNGSLLFITQSYFAVLKNV